METHAYLQSLCVGTPTHTLPSGQVPLHTQSCKHRTLRMILLRHRGTKDDQDTIASNRAEQAPIPLCLRVRQLLQRMQPALPCLQAALRIVQGRGYQRATENGDHFPLANRERVIPRQWGSVLRLGYRIWGDGQVMGGNTGTCREERYGFRCLARFAIGGYRYRGDEPITLAIARLDEALRLPVVTDGLAYGLETVFNSSVTDSPS